MFTKKAQGLPMNVIIIAALALLVLVILSIILITRSSRFTESADKCENNAGICTIYSGEGTCQREYGDYSKQIDYVCVGFDNKPDPNKVCCLRT